eukprot:COSAG06_NODE_24116_length_672_cov_1.099476_1_plen_54_part_10
MLAVKGKGRGRGWVGRAAGWDGAEARGEIDVAVAELLCSSRLVPWSAGLCGRRC